MTKSVFTPAYRLFLRALICARHDANLTQTILAQRLKKPQSYVSKYESGERRLDVIEALDILRVLNQKPADFFTDLEAVLPPDSLD